VVIVCNVPGSLRHSAGQQAGVILLVPCMLGAILFHIFILGDPFSSLVNVLLIFAIIAAGRNHKLENEDLIILELRGSQSEGARDGEP
jgi:hypothetical protein